MPTPEILARRQQLLDQASRVHDARLDKNILAGQHSHELSQVFQRQAEEIKPMKAAVVLHEDTHESLRAELLHELPRTAMRVFGEFAALWSETRKSRLKPRKAEK